MSVRFECPHCDTSLSASDPARLLKPVVCPKCNTRFQPSVPEVPEPATRVAVRPVSAPRNDGAAKLDFLSEEPLNEESGGDLPEPLFYKLDSTKVSLREYWWGSHFNPIVLLAAWLIKLFRVQIPSSTDDPPVKSITPFEASVEDIPDDVRAEFRPLVVELKRLGFVDPACHIIQDGHHKTTIHWLSLRHESGRAIVRCHRRYWRTQSRPRRSFFSTFVTRFSDGTYLTTTSGKADMLWPPVVEMHRDRKANAEELWEEHCRLLDDEAGGKRIRSVRDQHDLMEALEVYHELVTSFHVDRGVFAKMSTAEEARARAAAPVGSAVAGQLSENLAYSDVYDELQKQSNKKQNWLFFSLLLGISLVAFAALGTFAWSANTVLMLIPVLLFHEAGHYVAMKLSGYRNLKMFFIPLMGAAVSGQSLNVPSWKKVLVSLAGPVPGIVLGIALGIVGLVHHLDWLKELSMMFLVLNGINLIPILPFDGGWVVHALLFSRHYSLDVTFRAMAGLALLFISALSREGFLAALGVFMLISARTTYKLGKIAQLLKPKLKRQLRREETLSRETVNVIAREIDERFKQQSMNVKLRAQLASNVFEMIKSPAPGWLASFAFGGVYLGSILAATVFAAVLVVGRQANFAQLARVAVAAPTIRYQKGSTQVVEGPKASPAAQEVTVIAECADAKAANELFAEMQGQIPAAATFRVFGQTLLLALPANDNEARKEWSTKLEPRCKSVVVQSDVFSVPMTVLCIAPDGPSAEAIEQDYNDYAMGGQFKALISPWSNDPRVTPDQKRARKTLRFLQNSFSPEDQKATSDFYPKRREALRRGDKDAVAKIDAELKELRKKQWDQHIQAVMSRDDVDKKLIEIYARRPTIAGADLDDELDEAEEQPPADKRKFTKAYATWCDEMAARLGQLPIVRGKPTAGIDRYGSKSGFASQAGLILRFDFVQFNRPVDGIPSFAEWLYSQKCVDLKYRLGSAE
ncbi:MAG TPA: site-2 protease family protein [Planctomycetaceae bacterium]|jgi:Zn-dependent protease|nr:site-2 protease family protein [Planctomycetaceae bacterium]